MSGSPLLPRTHVRETSSCPICDVGICRDPSIAALEAEMCANFLAGLSAHLSTPQAGARPDAMYCVVVARLDGVGDVQSNNLFGELAIV